jgi:hypothetical protein
MKHLITRLTQGQRGKLGVIQTQAVYLHEPVLQGFIQRLMQRLLIPERFMARYGWGLRQRDEITLRFNIKRVEAIAPGESPEALWLSIQSRLPGFSRVSAQEEQCSMQENTIAQLPDREAQMRRQVTLQRAEESSSASENDGRTTSLTVRNSKQIPPIESTTSHSEILSESETFRVVRRVPYHSTDRAEMPSLSHVQPGEKGAIANTQTPSPQSIDSDDISTTKPIGKPHLEPTPRSPIEFISQPIIKSIVGKNLAKESASRPTRNNSTMPLNVALTDIDSLQHLTQIRQKQSSSISPIEIGDSLRIISKPKRNSLVQPSGDRQGSEAIAINEPLALTKLPSHPAIAESSPSEQAPLPLAIPKLHREKESRDRPAGNKPSTAWQNTTNAISEVSFISPTAPVINPINVEKITEQVGRQILRQLRLERERRGIYS